jgi:hypothetical protein
MRHILFYKIPVPNAAFIFTINDVEGKACTAQVDRARQFATRTIQIVVTTYWLDPQVGSIASHHTSPLLLLAAPHCITAPPIYPPSVPPPAQNDGVVDKYCVVQDVIERGKKVPYCRDWGAKYKTGTYKTAFYTALQACVQYANSKGFTGVVTLNPRLDQVRYPRSLLMSCACTSACVVPAQCAASSGAACPGVPPAWPQHHVHCQQLCTTKVASGRALHQSSCLEHPFLQYPGGRWRAELKFNPWEKRAGVCMCQGVGDGGEGGRVDGLACFKPSWQGVLQPLQLAVAAANSSWLLRCSTAKLGLATLHPLQHCRMMPSSWQLSARLQPKGGALVDCSWRRTPPPLQAGATTTPC